ncbi:MAG TPA: class I SAM-dependent methyltransferase, partial [Bacteroidota bacterium]|nr:class I SAM-dependent methyltransferase [Bacteroidota bacterium]
MPEKPEEMTTSHSTYIHGSKANEQARLAALNEYLNSGYIGVVRPRRGDKILDVGSGPGQFTLMMGEMTGHGTSVLGIERDERQLEQARRMLGSAMPGIRDIARVEFRQGDAMNLPLDPEEWGGFDLAHARFLLEHLPDPGSVVAGMAKAVRPGGRVFLSDDDHDVFRLT